MRALRAMLERERGGRRDGDEGADADGRRLLHELEAAAAGHHDEAGRRDRCRLRASAPISLSSALWRPTSSRTSSDVAVERDPGGAVDGAIEAVHRLALGQLGGRLEDGRGGRAHVRAPRASSRARRRRCSRPRTARSPSGPRSSGAPCARRRAPPRRWRCRRQCRSRPAWRARRGCRSGCATMPSASAKPMPKSVRFAGVAIITV